MAAFPLALALAALAWPHATAAPQPAEGTQHNDGAAALLSELKQMRAELHQHRRELDQSRRKMEALREKMRQAPPPYFRKEGNTLILDNMNLQIVSNGRVPGVGNLIVGLGHNCLTASNGVVVGENNTIAANGNFVAGSANVAQATSATVLGGVVNWASAAYATVLGGQGNTFKKTAAIAPESCGC
uniref:Uncharacterized protein n=1 Tax=Zooxanthella nutricula TaxID=1333877 RepID=A0A6U8Y7D7_9DINO|mmetsp:Transcript_28375/g.85551  ORF Transcript_28375/g.85551 Transcript_28375/m.85551 type:complete len:186 (+) Transcript_28375:97-654(+)